MSALRGHCLCGAVRWSCDVQPTRSLVCHCEDCQRATSAPFTGVIGFPPEAVSWSGAINHYESSPGTYRGFCPTCGSRLYFRSDKWPGEIHIHAASLDEPNKYRPDAQVVMRSKTPWLSELENIPQHHDFQASPIDRSGGADPRPD